MNDPFVILGVIVSVVLILLAIEVFLLPDVRQKRAGKKKMSVKSEQKIDLSPWQNKVDRLTSKVHHLTMAVEKYQAKEKEYERQLALEEIKNQKYQEKIKQEKTWQKSEHELVDKLTKQLEITKEDFQKEQETFSKEHQFKLALERENKSLQNDYNETLEKLRSAEKEITIQTGKLEQQRLDIANLKKDNIELKRVKTDTQWVAKSDFDQLKDQARTLQKELDRLKRENG